MRPDVAMHSQESHLSVLSMGVATITNFVGSGALEDLIWVVGVA
jgi:hypothetical protein